jgi:hypothetical protein
MYLLKSFPLAMAPRTAASVMGVAVVCVLATQVAAQDTPSSRAQNGNVTEATKHSSKFQGIGKCTKCHKGSVVSPVADEENRTDFCLLNESTFFTRSGEALTSDLPPVDIHRLAYARLGVDDPDSLGNRIWKYVSAQLSNQHPDKKKPLAEARQCLTCHSGAPNEPGEELDVSFLSFGVMCESCHGNAKKWITPHSDIEWRAKSATMKEEMYDLTDVRDPVRRAKVCYSCHIGNATLGRIVTHDMYAGGHPPLPPIEIETFAYRMPKHWRTIREKGEFLGRKSFLELNYHNKSEEQLKQELPQTRAMLVGGLVSLSESLRLFSSTLNSAKGPDLAAYDCFACHHELTSKSWRQERYSEKRSRPGQLRPLEWPAALASIGLRYADPPNNQTDVEHMSDALMQVDQAFRSKAFGDTTAISKIVDGKDGLAEWLEEKARNLSSRLVDHKVAEDAFEQLKTLNAAEKQDYYSAVQIVVAMRLIDRELATAYPSFPKRSPDVQNSGLRVEQDSADIKVFLAWRSSRMQADENIATRYDAAFRRPEKDPTAGEAPEALLLLDFPTLRKQRTDGVAFGPFLQAIRYYDPVTVRKVVSATQLQEKVKPLPEK